MISPGHQKFCNITIKGSKYSFENFRDFSWTSENKQQIQNRTNKSINIKEITNLNLYIIPFAFHNRVGHTILEFVLSDKQSICLSIEGQQNVGEPYKLIKAIFGKYRKRYIRASYKDIIGLRILRKEKVFKFPLYIPQKIIQTLFSDFALETNKSKSKKIVYRVVVDNCTGSLWNTATKHIQIPRRNIGLLFNKFLPRFLHKLGILNLSDKERIRDI